MKAKLLQLYNHPLFKSSLTYVIFDALNSALPFLLLPVLSYYLLPEEYGLVSNFGVINGVVIILVTLGVDGAISSNFFRFTKKEISEYISNALLIILIGFIFSLVCVSLLKNTIYNYTKIEVNYQYLAVLVALSTVVTNINLSLWRLEEKPRSFGIYRVLQTALNVIITLWLVVGIYMGWKGRVFGIATSSILFGGISLFLLYKRGYLNVNIKKEYVKDLLLFGVPLVPHGISLWIRFSIDKVYITKFLGEAANGLYSTGFQFGLLMSFIILAFNNAYVPFLFKRLSERNYKKLENMKNKLVKMTYGLMVAELFLALTLTFVSHILIDNLMSLKYQESRPFVFWAMLAQLFQGYYLLFGNYAFFVKKTRVFALITFICALIQLVLSYFLIKKIGVMGAAYSAVTVSFINFVAVMLYSTSVYKMPWLTFKTNR